MWIVTGLSLFLGPCVDEIAWREDYPAYFTILSYIALQLAYMLAITVLVGRYIYGAF